MKNKWAISGTLPGAAVCRTANDPRLSSTAALWLTISLRGVVCGWRSKWLGSGVAARQ